MPVTWERRYDYANLAVAVRLHEATTQIQSIRKGFDRVVRLDHMSLFSWFELETLVCGSPNIDVEALKRHTTYSSGLSSGHPVVRNLWKAVQSFSQEERRLFLRFVWGRNRLPATDSDWHQPFTISAISSGRHGQPIDGMLPISHTCFFALDLPLYSNYDILRSKMLFAIVNCQAIDADYNPNASSINTWV